MKSRSGALVSGNWIVVRTGEDGIGFQFVSLAFFKPYHLLDSSSGPTPELDYNTSTGEGTFRWTGPPAIVKNDTSYEIKYSGVYPGSTVKSSDLIFADDIQNASLPHTGFLSPSSTYVFFITASLNNGLVTSSYARISTHGRGILGERRSKCLFMLFYRMPSVSVSRYILSWDDFR